MDFLLGLTLLALVGGAQTSSNQNQPIQRISFNRAIGNIQYASMSLSTTPPGSVAAPPGASRPLFYGRIMRRLVGERINDSAHYIPFAVEYSDGHAVRTWCDTNLDGRLIDEAPQTLYAYPPSIGALSFIVHYHWNVPLRPGELAVDWDIRVVLDPITQDDPDHPMYHVQMVHVQLGEIEIAGKRHKALLFDGNGDGIYSQDFLDGIYVDLNDDLTFEMDPMSIEFGPLTVDFEFDGRIYEPVSVKADGSELVIREVGRAPSRTRARIGDPAPEFEFIDITGRRISLADYGGRTVLVYFWASWCSACRGHADALRTLYENYRGRGLEILAVSFDSKRSDVDAFRSKHSQTWPCAFSGRMPWEDRIGRLYGASGSGLIYLVTSDGRIDGIYRHPSEVSARLHELL